MEKIPIWVLFVSLFLLIHVTDSVDDAARDSLVTFFTGLSNNNARYDPNIGWNSSSDPCRDKWKGVACDNKTNSLVKKIVLDNSSLSGVLNVTAICNVGSIAASLNLLSLSLNNIGGEIKADIVKCKQLTRLFLGGNQFTGKLPDSMAMLGNLIQLDISNNKFGGELPGLARISCLQMFLAQNNQLTGEIPEFDFSNLDQFNVSNNNFQGPIPDVSQKFPANCYLNNPGLCGEMLQKTCPTSKKKSKGLSNKDILMFSGYIALGLVIVGLIIFRLTRKKVERVAAPAPSPNQVASVDDFVDTKPSFTSAELKTDVSKSEFSINSTESAMVSSSLVVLTSPTVSDLRFEDLLRAPAELLGRGKHGTLYRVIFENGMVLAVKRIKGWMISNDEFKQRMLRLDQAKHLNVLPPLAFYCSKHEKLLVYEYQLNGSLFTLLHGNQSGRRFEWASRLSVAAKIAEGLAFMHHELHGDGIHHGNLKSSNIMLKSNMEPCISEYGLMVMDPQEPSSMQQQTKDTATNGFKADIYGLGVILLELLTGKLVQNDGVNLTSWVHSVVHEEWTVEVFDKALISEGASEEEMLNLLHVAIKCVNQAPESRPRINQVATMINAIKEEEDKSSVHEP
ncbi:probable inactive receptor kinase At2g26730 [Hibiscus syriacus]|uniref:probable inactive receptor kinase At2g26730 n=1 Tax=Hibiscus syriacus TaxID=106335 RepID=UPI00192355DA|nr:probable inactive receptor kinase At2g26730 [Hibiscus syriacus]